MTGRDFPLILPELPYHSGKQPTLEAREGLGLLQFVMNDAAKDHVFIRPLRIPELALTMPCQTCPVWPVVAVNRKMYMFPTNSVEQHSFVA